MEQGPTGPQAGLQGVESPVRRQQTDASLQAGIQLTESCKTTHNQREKSKDDSRYITGNKRMTVWGQEGCKKCFLIFTELSLNPFRTGKKENILPSDGCRLDAQKYLAVFES